MNENHVIQHRPPSPGTTTKFVKLNPSGGAITTIVRPDSPPCPYSAAGALVEETASVPAPDRCDAGPPSHENKEVNNVLTTIMNNDRHRLD